MSYRALYIIFYHASDVILGEIFIEVKRDFIRDNERLNEEYAITF